MEKSNYVKELGEVLETCNTKKLIKFIEKWEKQGAINIGSTEAIRKKEIKYQQGIMAKMIMGRTDLSQNAYDWAKRVLDKLGWYHDFC